MTDSSRPLDPRLTEQRNPATREIDLADPLTIVDMINAEDRRVPEAVAHEREAIAHAIDLVVDSFQRGGRLFYVGAGTSGRLGVLDAAECPPTFGTEPEMVQGIIAGGAAALLRSQEGAEDDTEGAAAAIDAHRVGERDFVLGIATSSTTPFVREALRRARARGARTGFLCCTEPDAEIRNLVDVCIVPKVGPEVIAGSTRMKAGTATKLVLNTVSTGAMIRLGKVYENLMVDLQAWSQKLVDRGQRIVMEVTGCGREEARDAIERAGGSVKTALVIQRFGIGRDEAERLLLDASSFVRRAFALRESALREPRNPYAAYPESPPSDRALAALLDGLDRAPQVLRDLFAAADDARLTTRPAPDRWCAKEHVAHLTVANEMQTGRVRRILSEAEPVLPNFDETVENAKIVRMGHERRSAHAILEEFAASRARLMEALAGRRMEDFRRPSRHETLGRVTLYQLLRHVAAHDDHHAQGVRRLLAGTSRA